MTTSKSITLGVFALTAAFLLPGSLRAATCTVPGTHSTISAAAADSSCMTINVAPGVYNESVIVTHSCEINGAQAGNAFSGRISGGPAESTVNGSTPTGNVAV